MRRMIMWPVSYGCVESELTVSRVSVFLQGNFQGSNMCEGGGRKALSLTLENLSLSPISGAPMSP